MYEQVFESKYAELPAPLTELDVHGLRPEELAGLLNRMRLVDQLLFEINEWDSIGADSDLISSFIDRVELRSALCLALPSNSEGYSWWLVHTTLEPYPHSGGSIPPAIAACFRAEVPNLYSDRRQFDAWVRLATEAIQCGLEGFFSADGMPAIWRNLVALNSLVSLVFSGVSRQRLAR